MDVNCISIGKLQATGVVWKLGKPKKTSWFIMVFPYFFKNIFRFLLHWTNPSRFLELVSTLWYCSSLLWKIANFIGVQISSYLSRCEWKIQRCAGKSHIVGLIFQYRGWNYIYIYIPMLRVMSPKSLSKFREPSAYAWTKHFFWEPWPTLFHDHVI